MDDYQLAYYIPPYIKILVPPECRWSGHAYMVVDLW